MIVLNKNIRKITYSYSKPLASKKILKDNDSIQVSVKIKNTGLAKGKEIVQLYIEDEKCSLLRPKKELKGFHKVELEPNEEKTIQFHIDINDLTFFDDSKQKWIAEPGKFKAYIAASSEDIRGVVEFEYSNIE